MPHIDKKQHKREHKKSKEKSSHKHRYRSRSSRSSDKSYSSNYSPDYSSSSAEHWHKTNKRSIEKTKQSKIPNHLKKYENN